MNSSSLPTSGLQSLAKPLTIPIEINLNLLHIATSLIVGLVILSLSVSAHASAIPKNSEDALATLDSLLHMQDELKIAKLRKLEDLRQRLSHASSDNDRFFLHALLFDEFSTCQSDSAMKYADMNLALAHARNDKEWEIRSKIDKAELLCATGLLTESLQLMNSIRTDGLSPDLLVNYYGQMIFLYSHLANYTGGQANQYYALERNYRDSVMSVISEDHPEYLWYKGLNAAGADRDSSGVITALNRKISSSSLDSRQDAKDAYILSRLYQERGDCENYRKYMALSAIADVRIVNAEIASLEELSTIMFENGDIDRAYSYINYSLQKAIEYPNRAKAFGLARNLTPIYAAYQEKSLAQQQRTKIFLLIVCILSAILIATIAIIIFQYCKLRKQQKSLDMTNKDLSSNISKLSLAHAQINEANAKLKALNADLQAKNDELNEANYVKEEYIGYVFTICSNYITKLEELKKNIHVKAINKKYKEIAEDTADVDMKDELKDFYRSFDSIFLHIYPDFVKDFNALLQPDKQIIPKEGELLNTELRIYALVRLGISDSVKIAEFLHCSPQTVYNNRFRVRNKAKGEKKDFADTVRTLGKFMKPSS